MKSQFHNILIKANCYYASVLWGSSIKPPPWRHMLGKLRPQVAEGSNEHTLVDYVLMLEFLESF